MQLNNSIAPTDAQEKPVQPNSLAREAFQAIEDLIATGVVWHGPTERDRFLLDLSFDRIPEAEVPTRLNRVLSASNAAELAVNWMTPRFHPGELVEFRAFAPDRKATVENRHFDLSDPGQRSDAMAFTARHNGFRNIYMGVNPRKRGAEGDGRNGASTDKAVAARRQVLLDLDNKDAPQDGWEPHLPGLEDAGAAAVLSTGNGYHVYFDIEELTENALTASVALLRAVMARVGSDNVSDLPRIGRVPFTCNIPGTSKRLRGAKLSAAVPVFTKKGSATNKSRVFALEDLCTELGAFAAKANLPGRAISQGEAANCADERTGQKIGWAAPSQDIFEMALKELPNDPGGPFDSRDDWVEIGHALKGAAVQAGFDIEARALFVEWTCRNGGSPDKSGEFWDSCTNTHVGWGTVMQTLEKVNPAGYKRVHSAIAAQAFAQVESENRTALLSTASYFAPITQISPAAIPPRQWLYGRAVIAGFIHVLVAPGGAGKSSLIMSEAVAMAAGRELLAGEKPVRPLRVHIHNGEDDLNEMHRRLTATLMHFNLTPAGLAGGLSMSSGRDVPVHLARMGRNGLEEVPGAAGALVELLTSEGIEVLVLDPLGAIHGLPENDNTAMNFLAGILRRIAHEAGAAVILVHHSSKAASMDMDTAGAGASRGASAIVDAARIVRQVVRMTPKEAARFGVTDKDRRGLLRVENGKANLAPAAEAAWVRLHSVGLGNGNVEFPAGDFVAVAERWVPPGAVPGTASELKLVQDAITALPSPPRADPRSSEWVGFVAAAALGLDIGTPGTKAADKTQEQTATHARVKGQLASWLASGALTQETIIDQHRKGRVCIRVGIPADVLSSNEKKDEPGYDARGIDNESAE